MKTSLKFTLTLALALVVVRAGGDVVSRFEFPDKAFDLRAMIDPRVEAAYIPTAIKSFQVSTCAIGNTAATGTATLSPTVSTSNTMLVWLGLDSSDGTNEVGYIALTASNTVTCTRVGTSNGTTIGFAAVEFRPGVLKSIQRNTVSMAAGVNSGTAAITAVNTAKATVTWLGNSVTDGGANNQSGSRWFTRSSLTSSTQVTVSRNALQNTWATVTSFEVPEFF